MLRHVVVFRWKDGTTAAEVDAIAAALRALPGQIPELRAYDVGVDAGLSARQRRLRGRRRRRRRGGLGDLPGPPGAPQA